MTAMVRQGAVECRRVADGTLCATIAIDGSINSVAFARDGETIAFASDEGIQVWDVRNEELIDTLPTHAQRVAFSPDASMLAAVNDTTIQVWRLRDRTLLLTLDAHVDTINHVAFSHDGAHACLGVERRHDAGVGCCRYMIKQVFLPLRS
ncbi:MAG: hypothetical protein HC828_12030 [Blastochloris sp.]|nr:hypothetical protein [Blastochloris sp.]